MVIVVPSVWEGSFTAFRFDMAQNPLILHAYYTQP